MFRIELTLVSAALVFGGCGGCDEGKEVNREAQRLWGKDKIEAEFAEKAKEAIDAHALEDNPTLKSRVLGMRFEEVVARLGFVEYTGNARFLLKRNGHTIDVPESSIIRHGLHGSFMVRQLDPDGEITREIIYNNGVLYGQNGPKAKMRVMGIIDGAHVRIRDEAWQPLRVFSSYYGPRFGLRKIGSGQANGRSAAKYEMVLLDGSPLIEAPGMKGPKKPISLKGELYVDEGTGVPIKGNMKGRLEIPPDKPESNAKPGELDLTLTFDLKTIEGAEIKPKEFVPEIKRREVDLDPLAFLAGETRTSTVIGGKKNAVTPPPAVPAAPPAAPPPPAVEPPAEEEPPPATTPPKQTTKKKTKKKKKRK